MFLCVHLRVQEIHKYTTNTTIEVRVSEQGLSTKITPKWSEYSFCNNQYFKHEMCTLLN